MGLIRLAAVLLAIGLGGCGFGLSPESLEMAGASAERRELPGHVYLLRGLIGDVFSLGMDELASKIQKRGVKASVHGVSAARFLANDIVKAYRDDPSIAPIMLIGHSTGGDEIIAMAEKLKAANVPVALAVGFDPTPIASDVPANVELFINLYQATNIIGGGRATPGRGFRGRLINVDLRERREIVHITLDKNPVIHELVTEKIVGIAEFAAERRNALVSRDHKAQKNKKTQQLGNPSGESVTPLVMKYVVPARERIELWDSAIAVTATDGDTLESIAVRHGAPGWAVAQINALPESGGLQPGRRLLVPRNMYAPGMAGADNLPNSAFGAARIQRSSAIR